MGPATLGACVALWRVPPLYFPLQSCLAEALPGPARRPPTPDPISRSGMPLASTPNSKGKVSFRKLDAAGQIAHLKNRTKGIRLQTLRRSIEKCMAQHPECMEEIKDHLEGLGYNLATGESDQSPAPKVKVEDAGIKGPASSASPRAGADEDVATAACGETGGTGSGEGDSRLRSSVQDSNPKNWVPHRYTRFDNASVPFLASVLAQVEPISLSELALAPITSRGKKEEKLKQLCDCLEFCAGVSRETPLVGDKRHIPSLVSWLRVQSAAEGRRARELQIPAQWGGGEQDDGVYLLRYGHSKTGESKDNDRIVVEDRMTKIAHDVPQEERLTDSSGAQVHLRDLSLDFNWSAEKARITSPLSPDSILVLPLGHWGRSGKRLAVMQVKAHDIASAPVSRRAAALKHEEAATPPAKVAKAQQAPQPSAAEASKRSLAPEAAYAPPPPEAALTKIRICGKTAAPSGSQSVGGRAGAASTATILKAEREAPHPEDGMAQPVT